MTPEQKKADRLASQAAKLYAPPTKEEQRALINLMRRSGSDEDEGEE